jgi:peptide-methionine (R)-S-oxide reductase
MVEKIRKTDEEWRELLTPEQHRVLREKGTEVPGTGKYYHHAASGTYRCAACGNELFKSGAKFESGTGWPSFWAAASSESVVTVPDESGGRKRTEVLCARCGGHLGHLFADGPDPTGMRYCVNSVSLDFEDKDAPPEE